MQFSSPGLDPGFPGSYIGSWVLRNSLRFPHLACSVFSILNCIISIFSAAMPSSRNHRNKPSWVPWFHLSDFVLTVCLLLVVLLLSTPGLSGLLADLDIWLIILAVNVLLLQLFLLQYLALKGRSSTAGFFRLFVNFWLFLYLVMILHLRILSALKRQRLVLLSFFFNPLRLLHLFLFVMSNLMLFPAVPYCLRVKPQRTAAWVMRSATLVEMMKRLQSLWKKDSTSVLQTCCFGLLNCS